ncbi:MAG TPA: amino acid adenylation domain-containing protein [Thermoanaerobaculia bacterium]|nr:amino acid adenylation domain-containing protein [Thermoanaerobaculia bacterium]
MDTPPSSAANGIAIIGMAGRFPDAVDVERFWENLVAGVESVRFFSAEELRAVGVASERLADPAFVRARAVISDAELFDAGLFGLTPREAEVIDPQHRLLLECAWEALESAGHDPRRFPGTVGVFAGAGVNTYLLSNLQHNQEVMAAAGAYQAMMGSGGDFLATRISYKLGLKGPSLTVQTACSTSLVAVHLAVQSLLAGECDLALAGGVRLLVPRQGGHMYQPGSIFSQDGHCRPFDAAATGTTEGEGLGLVVLRRLADAMADGDHVHAVILGSAINNDGAEKLGYTVPSVEGQAGVIALAQALAGVEAGTIGLIEAHGTGTPLGDPIEGTALSQVFSMSAASAASATPARRIALGSLKSNMGHLDAAAGVASLLKAALAVEHGIIPPSLHFERPNPQLDLAAGGFYVPVTATPWVEEAGPRRAGVSSFGIGGTNAHVVLEEAPAVEPGSASRPLQLLVLSARTPAAVEQATRRLAEHLGRHPEFDIADVAYTLQVGRVAFDPRRIVVCESTADAAEVLSTLDPKRVLTRTREAGERPVFFLFSGQGAQYPGMGAELYASEAVFREEVDRCAEILRPRLGLDLRQVLYPALYPALFPKDGDPRAAAERLQQTALAQPALFVVEYALARLWTSWGVRPEAMLGHSIGEYVAACLAGVFSLPDALGLVAERGRLMQEMPGGSMLAVPLPEAEVRLLLGGLSLAAVNGPAMCGVSGDAGEVAALAEQLAARGLQVRRLHTSHAFHSASMEPVLARFAAAFAGLRLHPPAIPFVSNRTGTWIRPEEATSPDYWVRHLRETVRFADGLAVLFGRAGAVFLEVGPGRALSSLVRQQPQRPEAPSVLASLPTAGDGRRADATVLRTLGELWLAGVEIDWAGFHAGERRRRVPLPTYPFERQRYWVEPDAPAAISERGKRRRSAGDERGVADWFWAPLWRQALPSANGLPDAAAEGSWLLLADGNGLGERLAARLRERGREVVVAQAGEEFLETDRGDFVLRPGAAADYGALLDRLAGRGIVPGRIVHLWSASPSSPAIVENRREQERGFYSLFHLARALGERRPAERRPPLHLGVVSSGVQRITGADELVPVRATLLGPAATIPQEYPGISCAAIDVTLPTPGSRAERRLVDRLLAELATPPGDAADPVVAYRGTDRWLRVWESLHLASSPGELRLREGGTYLITGGLGGVGLELAAFLARQAKVNLVLTGRAPFPEREAWPALAQGVGRHAQIARIAARLLELEAAGAAVWTAAADVADEAAMRRVLDAVCRRFGRIDGAIHAAGLPGGGLMQYRSLEAAAAVLAPKVEGTQVLAALLADLAEDAPDFLVLCSSLNALAGGLGQADYTAANAFLDAFAQSCSGELPVVSINWDAWQGVGMAALRHAAEEAPRYEVADLRPFAHPLLRERGVDGKGAQVFVGRLRPAEHWILDEHRLGGHPVVPGTAYLEMAGAAFREISAREGATEGAIEIRDVQFITPMSVEDDESREVHATLTSNGDGFHHFSVRSREGDGWQEHALGAVGRPALAEEPARIDVAALDSWDEEILGDDYREDLKQIGLGPRWEVLKKIYRKDGEFVGQLELAPELAGDVQSFRLHPALLDAATSFAEYLVPGAGGNYYLPLSYKRLRMLGPLPSRIYSHARLRHQGLATAETLSFDITVLDEMGGERVRIEEFTLKRVDVSATLRGHAHRAHRTSAPPALAVEGILEGMPAEQAVEAFRRILAGDPRPQIAVSVRPLPEVLERTRSVTVESLAAVLRPEPGGGHARPDLATPYVAPRGELEERLAAIWADVLGLDRVGAADDFFALGGHSLLGTQVMSRVREAFGVEVPLGKLFEAATVADFAAVVEAQRAAIGTAIPAIPVISHGPHGVEQDLSFSQERLWFLEQLEPGSAFYSIPGAVHMAGRLSFPALAAALAELVRRHESLRTTFADRDGRPRQVVAPPPAAADLVPLPRVELSGLPGAARQAELSRLLASEVRQPFDLQRGPLLRLLLLALAPREQVIAYVFHHIVSDAWSAKIFRSEIAALYGAFAAGRPSPLPPVTFQYADYVAWQRRHLTGEVLAEQLVYWRQRLTGCPVLELPTDRPRPAIETFRGHTRPVRLSAAMTRGLHALSQSHGVTLFMTVLAVFKTLLLRTAGQSDLAVGSPIANRGRKELEGVIGFFANTMVLRTDLSGNPSFRELLGRVRQVTLGAYAHEQLPFERLVEEVQPERDMSRNPLFQVLCVLQNQPERALPMGDLRMSELPLDSGTAKFDLTFMWIEEGEILEGLLEHNSDLFDATTVGRLFRCHEALFAAVLSDPGQRLLDLPMLGAAERHQLLAEWNDTAKMRPAETADRCVHEWVEDQVRRQPAAVAARFDGASLSYGELDRRANRLAHALRRRGVGPESRVGVSIGRSLPMVVSALAVLKAGGALVALDPAYPLDRLAIIVEDAGLAVLLVDEAMRERFPAHREITLVIDAANPAIDPVAGESAEAPVSGVGPDHPMYAIYTSGSTGRPKGIVVPHRAFANFLAWQLQVSGGEPVRTVQFAAFGFCVSFQEIFSAWCSGGTLVVAGEMSRRDFAAFGGFLETEGIERLHLPYAALKQLAESSVDSSAGRAARPSRLREVITAGEPLQVTPSVRQLFAGLPGCTLSNQYGASETHVVTALTLLGPAAAWPAQPAVGRPIANVSIHLLDEHLRPAPIGVRGEICAGGACVPRCYLNDPVLTAVKLVPDPYGRVPGGRLYRTGDLGRRSADGLVESLGRIDGQVKVRGFRVELGEVETVLSRQPGVRDAAVVPQGVGEELKLVAYVVPGPESGPEADLVESLRQALQRRLPEYMVPAAFVPLAALPVNANGKLDVPALPAPEARRSAVAYRPPRTPAEELLAGVWREILGVERVGLDDSFFELGGHSLLATQVVSRARSAFGVELPVRALFEAPTLAGLAQRIEALRGGGGDPPTVPTIPAAPPLVPLPRSGPVPLSFAQERLWFIEQLRPGSPLYNLPMALDLGGPLDVRALAESLAALTARHEALRTTFGVDARDGGRPVQVVQPPSAPDLSVVDLEALPEPARRATLTALAAVEGERPFDLARGPLVRAVLLRAAADRHVALFTAHHAVTDGWSMGILAREMGELYTAQVTGRPAVLPALPVQYADFAAWQRGWLSGEVMAAEVAWWRQRLAGAPAVLDLPLDRPRPAVDRFRGERRGIGLRPDLAEGLERLALRSGATRFIALLALFEALLARATGQLDLPVGTPVAGRNRAEIEPLIGMFVNTLVLRGDLSGDPGFAELLLRVRENALDAFAHQELPFEKLVEELAPARRLEQTPLFQVMFVLDEWAVATPDFPGLKVDSFALESRVAKFDLTMAAGRGPAGWSVVLDYNTDLFRRDTILRMLGHFEALLAGALADPGLPLSRLALLRPAERHQLLLDWNDAASAYPREAAVHALFAARAERYPERLAVAHGGVEISYGELDRRADRLAHRLRALGVGPESRVGLFLARSVGMVVAMLGTLKAGGAYVPLDPGYPPERLARMVADAGIAVLVSEPESLASCPETRERVLLSEEPGAPVLVPDESGAESLAYVIYTSGSTGRPKGIAVSHRAVVRLVVGTNYAQLGEADRVAHASNVSFDAATFEVWGALLNGGTVVVIDKEVILSPADLARTLRAERVTALFLTTALFNQVAREEPAAFQSLRHLLFGGEAVEPGAVARVLAAGAPERLLHVYGPTESTTYATWHRVREVPAGTATLPIGQPLANTTAYVLDRRLDLAALGEVGELCLGGEGLARGYLGHPERTAERFVPRPWSGAPGERLYRTGDLVRRRFDGAVEFVGRLDQQVKIRGFRIEPGEIEAALAALPEVAEGAVLARRDGPGELRLVAYVVPASGVRLREDRLREELRKSLPDYMLPGTFVFLDALPLTPNGKLDRVMLAALAAVAALRASGETGDDGGAVAPRDPVEGVLAGIWEAVLGRERVGVTDDFFALGGHSLLATQVVSRIREVFQVELPLRQLFERPTIAGLARAISMAMPEIPAPPIRPVPRGGDLPLSFAQQRLWFIDQLTPGNPAYNVPWAVRLEGEIDVPLLAATFGEVVRRHESLRTVFAGSSRGPVQRVRESLPVSPLVTSLEVLPEAVRPAEVRRLVREEALRSFDLTRGPLLRSTLLRLSSSEHVLLLTMHHIVSDGWSMGVLLREIAALYEAFSRQQASPLPKLPVQYADFALWQREWLSGEVLETQLAYWREQLAGAPTRLELATDRPRPASPGHPAGLAPFHLDGELSRALAAFSRAQGVTLFMTLLAAFGALLGRTAGQPEVLLGTPIANRTRREIEGLIGFFVNTLVLRVPLGSTGSSPSSRQLLGRVRRAALDAYTHQDLPFERLVEAVVTERDLDHSLLFQALFALQNAPVEALLVPGLSLLPLEPEPAVAKFDLTLTCAETPAGLSGHLEYDAEIFDRTSTQRLLARYEQLLRGMVAEPERSVRDLPLLLPVEREQLVVEWNDSGSVYPREASVHGLFAAWAAAAPEAPALLAAGEEWSYGRLAVATNRLARHLRALGVGPESPVGVAMERSADLVVALLAVLKAGGAYLPLNPDYPDERLRFLLADTAATVVLVHGRTRERLAGIGAPGAPVTLVCLNADREAIAEQSAADLPEETLAGQLAYVTYTSGSTGKPKGVAVPHRAIVRLVRETNYLQLGPDDRVAHVSSLSFDAATFEIWGALTNGGALVVIEHEVVLSPVDFASRLAAERVTVLLLTTALFNQAVREEPAAFYPLRCLLIGGEAADPGSVARALAAGPPERLLNVYGPTESATLATWAEVREVAPQAPSVPIGRPVANTTAYVVGCGEGAGDLVPLGQVGELWLGGEGLARGYFARPERTAERFVPHPWSGEGGERLYRTGDLVRQLGSGEIDYLGRLDQQVKIRGLRIEPGEVEAALANCPGIEAAAVLARRDTPGDARLVAYLVARSGERVSEETVREELKRSLPEYMLPAVYLFLPSFPLTPNGKLDRAALPAPAGMERRTERYLAPRGPIEGLLVGIWEAVLEREPVGVEDDFFALGGHSLLATQVVSRARETFGVELPLHDLFERPTVARLAAALESLLRGAERPEAPPLLPAARETFGGELPLSFAQQRLWFIDQLAPGNPAYNMPWAIEIAGDLAVAALGRTFAEVVRRHEVLRTVFDGPVQQVREDLPPTPLPVTSLEALPLAARQVEVRRLAREEALRAFDLARGPLLRLTLLRLSGQEHMLLVTMHHIVSDGWSMGVLLREIAVLYDAFSRDQGSPLAELPVQYADFAVWQREWLSGEVLEEQLAYWRGQLAGAPHRLALATDRPRPAFPRRPAGLARLQLDGELSRALAAFSRAQGVTLFMTLLAAFGVLLGRTAGQPEVLVGTPIANRTRREIEGLIGFFVNTLVLRVSLESTVSPEAPPSARQLLARVRQVALDAYTHQDLPFERLVEEVVTERDLANSPLFQVLFALQNAPVEALALPGLSLRPAEPEPAMAKFDLTLTCEETPAGLSGHLEYDAEIFDRTSVLRLLGRYAQLLREMMADPERSVLALPLLLPAEREQLLVEWNDSGSAFPRQASVHRLFAAWAAATPEAPAVVTEGEEWSYGRLSAAANRLAWHLRSLGVGPESRVGVVMERSADLLVALLAVLTAGGAYVPLDPGFPDERLRFLLADSATAVVLVHGRTRERLASICAPGAPVSLVCVEADREAIAERSAAAPPETTFAEQLAYVIYTSGSTGKPKGVAVTHQAIVRLVRDTRYFHLGPGDRVSLASNISFDAATYEVWGALLNGGALVVIDPPVLLSPVALARLLAAARVTTLFLTTALFNLVVREEPAAFGRLRRLLIGGETVDPGSMARALSAGAPERLIHAYGPTESTTFATWTDVGEVMPGALSVSIGRPFSNTTVYLLDSRAELVPLGEVGELYLGGFGLARGYLARPELTAERFVPHPWSPAPGARLYRTGDLVRFRSDGRLDFLGRIDTQVKIRGLRIEPGEIEAVLRDHPAVREVAVALFEREGDKRLVAYVVPAAGSGNPGAELRRHLEGRLPSYMVPAAFVPLESLPLLANGKLDRAALPAPREEDRPLFARFVPPRTETEERIAAVWREVLGVAEVGIHDSFFELGGHSLLVVETVKRLRHALGRELSVVDVFRHPTVETLARALEPAALPSPGRSRDGGEDRGAARRDLIRQRRGAAVKGR